MSKVFSTGSAYLIHYPHWAIGRLPRDVIADIEENHAGAYSHIREEIIQYEFSNMERLPNNTEVFDFRNTLNRELYPCRGFSNSKNKASLTPSKMQGTKRKFNHDEFTAIADTVPAHIIVLPYASCSDMLVVSITADALIDNGQHKKSVSKQFISRFLGMNVDALYALLANECGQDNAVIEFDVRTQTITDD